MLFLNLTKLLLQQFLFLALTIWNVAASLSSSQSEFTHVSNEGLTSFSPFHTYSFDSLGRIHKHLNCSLKLFEIFVRTYYFESCHQYTSEGHFLPLLAVGALRAAELLLSNLHL